MSAKVYNLLRSGYTYTLKSRHLRYQHIVILLQLYRHLKIFGIIKHCSRHGSSLDSSDLAAVMKIPETDLSENITVQSTDLEIREFHDLKIATGTYFFRFTCSARDREIARDKGILKTEILRELAGTVPVLGYAVPYDHHIPARGTLGVIGGIG